MESKAIARKAVPTFDTRVQEDPGRFAFGANWRRFLDTLTEERIQDSVRALQKSLRVDSLERLRFLDIGSGSGLSSLAARRMGAEVHSFDYDPLSVACTRELKRRFYPDDADWRVEQGSALDQEYLSSLGKFDIVYSWGVLHHTGDLRRALALADLPVERGGLLIIAIYNNLGNKSRYWKRIKQIYNSLPPFLRSPFVVLAMAHREAKTILKHAFTLDLAGYIRLWTDYHKNRGMSRWHDFVDWVGGYPYEVARPEEIFRFYRKKGYVLENFQTSMALGNNEFVFRKIPAQPETPRLLQRDSPALPVSE